MQRGRGWAVVRTVVDTVLVFSLFVEKLPTHRDYQKCSIPERQVIMKVTHTHTSLHLLSFPFVMLTAVALRFHRNSRKWPFHAKTSCGGASRRNMHVSTASTSERR